MRIGLTSVTFRTLSAERICALAKEAGLSIMEWGTDVHAVSVPEAERIRTLCEKAGLTTVSLGSYYRVGVSGEAEFLKDLEIAKALGAGRIRLWLGGRSSADTDDALREQMKSEVLRLSDLAAKEEIEIAFEFHRKTLNDNGATSVAFLREIDRPNVKTYWQPFFEGKDEENLLAVRDMVSAVHVFSWDARYNRYPFAEKAGEWEAFLSSLAGRIAELDFIMEFVKDDEEAQFLADARDIGKLLSRYA